MTTAIIYKTDTLRGNHVLLAEIILPFEKTHGLIGCISLLKSFYSNDARIVFHDLALLPIHFSHTEPDSSWGS